MDNVQGFPGTGVASRPYYAGYVNQSAISAGGTNVEAVKLQLASGFPMKVTHYRICFFPALDTDSTFELRDNSNDVSVVQAGTPLGALGVCFVRNAPPDLWIPLDPMPVMRDGNTWVLKVTNPTVAIPQFQLGLVLRGQLLYK